LDKEVPGFDEKFIITKPQQEISFNMNTKDLVANVESKELEIINNKREFVEKANQLSPKKLNSVLKKL